MVSEFNGDFMDLAAEIDRAVFQALEEDVGTGDLTALLIPRGKTARASVISRENATLCGTQWFEACFKRLDPQSRIDWFARDGDSITTGQKLCDLTGDARALLTGERSALNFLQTLSAVATQTKLYVSVVSGTGAVIVDTRKTLPGLRLAQKYAVICGGGINHRMGLYDGILIKENHIISAGGIDQVMNTARKIAPPGVFIQIEVETLDQLRQALDAGAEMVLLDNFDLEQLSKAVDLANSRDGRKIILEASGGVTVESVRMIAMTGVHRISVGSLTKNIRAVDLSMRIQT
jgi:nicotinate-nucleotide pyrophosphorylase (carboxylating)